MVRSPDHQATIPLGDGEHAAWQDGAELPAEHEPATQLSFCVQALSSLQVVPSAATGFEHEPLDGLHAPAR